MDFVWKQIQDILFTSAMVDSGVPLLGEDTMDDVLDMRNAEQAAGENKEYEKTKDEFLDYLEKGLGQ